MDGRSSRVATRELFLYRNDTELRRRASKYRRFITGVGRRLGDRAAGR
jgi:hypothetical protein